MRTQAATINLSTMRSQRTPVASPRAMILVIMLALTLVLAGLLAYEAIQASRSHRVTLERALSDYASVAAWEFLTNGKEDLDRLLGDALGPATGSVAASPYDILPSPAMLRSPFRDILTCADSIDRRLYFRLDFRDGTLVLDGNRAGDSVGLAQWLRDTIPSHYRSEYRPEWRYGAVFRGQGRRGATTWRFTAYAMPSTERRSRRMA